jgi:hypothetical protein
LKDPRGLLNYLLTIFIGMGDVVRKFVPPFKFVIDKRLFLAKIVDTKTGSATPGWKLLTMTLVGFYRIRKMEDDRNNPIPNLRAA